METQKSQTETPPPQDVLMQMIMGFMLSQAIYVAAKLGIADLLKEKPGSAAALAKETGTDERSLYRVLRALAGAGIFSEVDEGYFGLTPLAECLRTDAPGSLRASSIFMGEDWHLRPWGDIMHSVKTGQTAFEHVYGKPFFPYIGEHREEARVFDDAMTSMSSFVAPAITAAYDFKGIETLVDVAGGHGLLLASILKANPAMKGILFDVPQVTEGARRVMSQEEVSERCQIIAGDFFSSVPKGADAYLMKHIIHDWDDERALKILGNCHRAMRADGKLLLVEMVIPQADEPSPGKFLDLEMLIFPGGLERTEAEYRALLAKAGFELTNITPTQSPMSVVEARRV
jgi:ubiquinone/menaquinone biosynthesis C-methylase UbiE